ncbi:MAG: hypothetical protein RLZZ326_2789, partial [Planctomycetota bacterium]
MSDTGSAPPSATAGTAPATIAYAELLAALIHGIAVLGKLGPLRRAGAVEHLLPPSLRIATARAAPTRTTTATGATPTATAATAATAARPA